MSDKVLFVVILVCLLGIWLWCWTSKEPYVKVIGGGVNNAQALSDCYKDCFMNSDTKGYCGMMCDKFFS